MSSIWGDIVLPVKMNVGPDIHDDMMTPSHGRVTGDLERQRHLCLRDKVRHRAGGQHTHICHTRHGGVRKNLRGRVTACNMIFAIITHV